MKLLVSISIILFFHLNSWADFENDSTKIEVDSNQISYTKFDEILSNCLGTAYKWGGESLKGFDCSGFVRYVYLQFKINLPHSSKAISNMGTKIPLSEAKKGDLIIFTGYKDSNHVGHLGIVLENKKDSLIFIHSSSAPKSMGVVKTNYYQSNYPKRFIKIIRLK